MTVDIQRALKILDLDRKASMDDINQAYKDSVSVWHPDRFTHNPRLKRKAEEKIKEVNMAYETLKSIHARRQRLDEKEQSTTFADERGKGGATEGNTTDETKDKTEAAFEIGTQLVLTAWSYLSSGHRRVIDTQTVTAEKEKQREGKK